MRDDTKNRLLNAIRQDALTHHAECRRLLDQGGALSSDDVHTLRAATKRLRASWELLLPLVSVADAAAAQEVKEAKRKLAEAAHMLSDARDRVVLVETLVRMESAAKNPRERERLAGARALLFGDQAPAVPRAKRSPELGQAFEEDQSRWERLAAEVTDIEVLQGGLGRLYRRAHKLARKARRSGDVDAWHRCRKWTKYLRYTLPLLSERNDLGRTCHELRVLGGLLGELHDLGCLRSHLGAERAARGRPGALRGVARVVRRHEKERQEACEALSREVFARSSKRLVKRLGRT